MSLGFFLLTSVAAAAAKAAAAARANPSIPATANGAGLDGIGLVENWPGGWKVLDHRANIDAVIAAGKLGPLRFVEIEVHPRLKVWVTADALSIGDSPRCRIPINASGAQRIADKLSKQLNRKLMMITPRISDAVHLHAARGNGRVLDVVSIWNDPNEPVGPRGIVENQGQNVAQWLRQQRRIQRAIVAAGGYPANGVISTVGKDCVLAPQSTETTAAGHVGGEAKGAKLLIYGWHTKTKPTVPPHRNGPWPPQSPADLAALGWYGIQQGESARHTDQEGPAGGFWDYSSAQRYALDDCTLDGKPASLASVYARHPELVYTFAAGAPTKAIPARYPLVPVAIA